MSKNNLLNEATIRRFMKLADMEPLTSPFVERLSEKKHWGSKEREYKRRDVDGVEKKAGDIDHHYKDYEMNEDEHWGEKKRERKRRRGPDGVEHETGDIGGGKYGKGGHYKDYEMNEDAHEEDELHATEDELGDEDAEADRERDEIDDLEADDDAGGALTADEVKDVLMNALQDFAASVSDDLDIDMDVSDDDAPEMEVAAVAVDDDGDEVEMDAEEAMLESIQVVDDTELINEVAKRVTARLVKAMATKK